MHDTATPRHMSIITTAVTRQPQLTSQCLTKCRRSPPPVLVVYDLVVDFSSDCHGPIRVSRPKTACHHQRTPISGCSNTHLPSATLAPTAVMSNQKCPFRNISETSRGCQQLGAYVKEAWAMGAIGAAPRTSCTSGKSGTSHSGCQASNRAC